MATLTTSLHSKLNDLFVKTVEALLNKKTPFTRWDVTRLLRAQTDMSVKHTDIVKAFTEADGDITGLFDYSVTPQTFANGYTANVYYSNKGDVEDYDADGFDNMRDELINDGLIVSKNDTNGNLTNAQLTAAANFGASIVNVQTASCNPSMGMTVPQTPAVSPSLTLPANLSTNSQTILVKVDKRGRICIPNSVVRSFIGDATNGYCVELITHNGESFLAVFHFSRIVEVRNMFNVPSTDSAYYSRDVYDNIRISSKFSKAIGVNPGDNVCILTQKDSNNKVVAAFIK